MDHCSPERSVLVLDLLVSDSLLLLKKILMLPLLELNLVLALNYFILVHWESFRAHIPVYDVWLLMDVPVERLFWDVERRE